MASIRLHLYSNWGDVMSKHTPTPWKVDDINTKGKTRIAYKGFSVAYTDISHRTEQEQEANAAHIVKCVNLHDELVAVVEFECDRLYQSGLYSPDELARLKDLLRRARGEK